MNAAGMLRCFVGIQAGVLLSEGFRSALDDLRESAERSGWRVSWTQPEGWHVTLKFLGEVDVHARQQFGHHLDDGDFDAEGAHHAGEFATDHASADHQ